VVTTGAEATAVPSRNPASSLGDGPARSAASAAGLRKPQERRHGDARAGLRGRNLEAILLGTVAADQYKESDDAAAAARPRSSQMASRITG
jgi:hypothetical protein